MKIIKAIIVILGTTFLGMFGGQREKGARRFGIPSLAVVLDYKRNWPFVLLAPVLILGYGEKSVLMGLIHNEVLVRLSYSTLLSLPTLFFGVRRWIVSAILLGIVFQVHAGSVGYVSWFGDILVEDIVRYSTLGCIIAYNMIVK